MEAGQKLKILIRTNSNLNMNAQSLCSIKKITEPLKRKHILKKIIFIKDFSLTCLQQKDKKQTKNMINSKILIHKSSTFSVFSFDLFFFIVVFFLSSVLSAKSKVQTNIIGFSNVSVKIFW